MVNYTITTRQLKSGLIAMLPTLLRQIFKGPETAWLSQVNVLDNSGFDPGPSL